MKRCEMWRWEDVKMRRCENVKMRRCEDEKIWRWENVKMFEDVYNCIQQTPTIRRTLRSDALGKKWSEPVSFYDSGVKSSSRYGLMLIFSTTFRIEERNRGNSDPPAATTDSHFTRKKHKVLRPRMFSALNSHVPDRSHFPTTWWCDWHDDVIDMMIEMMMRLPWWWDS